jgi:hypothetical protein
MVEPLSRRRSLLLVAALAAAPAAQVAPGHAVVLTAGLAVPAGLFLYEPLHGRFVPVDTSSLPGGFQLSGVWVAPDGQDLLLAGLPAGASDDVVLRSSLLGAALRPPVPFVHGLAGRTRAVFAVAATAQVVVVTGSAVFAAPAGGGAARRLTPAAADMGNLAAAFLPPRAVVTASVDATGQASLWQLDLGSLALASIALRMSGRLCVAPGPTRESVLLGEPQGQLWVANLATLARAPWVDLGRGPLRALWRCGDQQVWIAAVGTDLQLVRQQVPGPSVPLPGGLAALDLAYRPYGSTVTAYGPACAGTAGPAAIGWQGLPVPGNAAFALTVENTRPTTAAVLLLGVLPANIPLDLFGMTGCVLLTQPLLSLTASTSAVGTAQVPVAIPPDPWLAGARFHAQWLVVDPGSNRASLVTSNAARVDI